MGFTTDLQRIYNGTTTEGEVLAKNSLKPVLISGMGFRMVFTPFLKDNVHIVITNENNGIIVTRAFLRVFQAYRTRRISQEIMLIVMLLRLSAAYILSCNSHIKASLSLS